MIAWTGWSSVPDQLSILQSEFEFDFVHFASSVFGACRVDS